MKKDSAGEKKPPKAKFWQSPLLLFTLVGGVLAVGHWQWQEQHKPTIRLTSDWVRSLELDYERRAGVMPDPEEKAAMVKRQLEQEILFHESVKAGNLEDPRVKNLLAAIYRESLEPVLADPTDKELQDFRAEYGEAYQLPAEIGFQHVTYARKEDVPPGVLGKLRSGGLVTGDPAVRLANPLPLTFAPQLEQLFGRDFLSNLQRCKPGVWEGPFESARGVHFVRVSEIRQPREMDFASVKAALTSQWMKKTRDDSVSEQVEAMKPHYHIILPEEGGNR